MQKEHTYRRSIHTLHTRSPCASSRIVKGQSWPCHVTPRVQPGNACSWETMLHARSSKLDKKKRVTVILYSRRWLIVGGWSVVDCRRSSHPEFKPRHTFLYTPSYIQQILVYSRSYKLYKFLIKADYSISAQNSTPKKKQRPLKCSNLYLVSQLIVVWYKWFNI